MKYTKSGKHRYQIFFFNENQRYTHMIDEGIGNKNVIDVLMENDVSILRSKYDTYKKEEKRDLNRCGFIPYNSAGYLGRMEDDKRLCI